ncbi:MAG: FkbM family methyltransferase [Bacteroidetes bacterium]|jgi:FkbM family methyltransferase|nr:FkbM family methyltransferase [Bacteroidota bacterium]
MKNLLGIRNRDPWMKIILYLKDVYFTPPFEHLYRAAKFAKRSGISKNTKSIIIDAGSYDGLSCLFFSSQFPNASIKAFEPNPEILELINKNITKKPNIELFPVALSNVTGESTFHITQNQVSSSLLQVDAEFYAKKENETMSTQLKVTQEIKVPTKRLDDYNFEEVLLLKMDTQGNELNLINGAQETLKKTYMVVTEMAGSASYEGSCHYFETDEALRKLGFEAVDWIVAYRRAGIIALEFDMIYVNSNFKVSN